ncbi:MAG: hypothetical protein LBC42_01640, partial [Puniceicoccales bacterium]|nr:hypothetical protein [Puniceicoccales bacterium]
MVSIANVRIACDGTHFDGPFNRLDGRKITIWRSCDLRLELAVFDRGILQNIGNLSTITVQVKPMGPNDSAPLSSTAPVMAKTVTAETFDETLTLEEWENGAGQHVVVEFSGEETDMEAGDAWLVIWATTVDNPAKILILSAGRIAVHESSGGIVTSIPDGPLENFYDRTTCDILFVRREKNLSDITSPDAARDNLGIGEVAAADLLNENDMASDSTEAAPTQHSVKAFVESIASETSATLLEEIGSATGSASVKEKYESNSDTNAYTDSDKTIVGTVGNVANLTTTTKTSTVAAINEIVSDLADYVPKTRTINGKALSSNITLINADIGSEPSIAAGTTSQYWRGDKTWVNFPAPSPSGGSVQDFWPANGFGRFSSYVLHPRFSSTGGICGPDGWMLFSENGSEAHKDYFESSTTFGSGRFGDLVFS